MRAASSEWPPRSRKKSSCTDTGVGANSFSHTATICFSSAVRGGTRSRRSSAGRVRGRGQALAINLAAGERRQLRERFQQRRNHVGRQARAQPGADGLLVERSGRLRHDVGDQLLDAGHILAQRHRRRLDAGTLQQHRLDLRQLDPEAANLHLGVDAAKELQLAPSGVQRARSPVR